MWRIAGTFIVGLGAILAMAMAAAFRWPASPLYMPATDCRPDRARYDSLPFGAGYEAVARHLGCPGAKAKAEDLGGVVRIVTYVWRADSWPVGIVRLAFYNDTLQAKSETRLDLRLGWPK